MADPNNLVNLPADVLSEILLHTSPKALREACKINVGNLPIVCQGEGNYTWFWKKRIKRDFPWVKKPFIADSWLMTWKYLTECVLFSFKLFYIIVYQTEYDDEMSAREKIPSGVIENSPNTKNILIEIITDLFDENKKKIFDNFVYYFDNQNNMNLYFHAKNNKILQEISSDEKWCYNDKYSRSYPHHLELSSKINSDKYWQETFYVIESNQREGDKKDFKIEHIRDKYGNTIKYVSIDLFEIASSCGEIQLLRK